MASISTMCLAMCFLRGLEIPGNGYYSLKELPEQQLHIGIVCRKGEERVKIFPFPNETPINIYLCPVHIFIRGIKKTIVRKKS